MDRMMLTFTAPAKEVNPVCPAPYHNTTTAARGVLPRSQGGGKVTPCVCNYAQWLNEKRLRKARDYEWTKRRGLPPSLPSVPQWYTGPWRLAPECSADRHWSRRSARGKYGTPCVCPRARALMQEEREALLRLTAKTPKTEIPVTLVEVRRSSVNYTHMPDLSRGACSRPENFATFERGHDRNISPQGIANRSAAKKICGECPLSTAQACRQWARTQEHPRGSWSGIYGGLDPWQRTERLLVQREEGIEAVPFKIGGPLDALP
jgi:hypothetical protein